MASAKRTPVAEPDSVETTPQPDPKDSEPVVRVSTAERKRPIIEIDGKQYEMRRMGDFGIGKQQQINRDGQEFGRLWTSEDELTEGQQKRLKFLLDRLYGEVMSGVPKTVSRALDDAERADVVLTFSMAPLRQAMAALLANSTEQTTEAAESPSISTS